MHAPQRRRALPLAALAFTMLTISAAFVVRRALACPVEIPPQTLRTLYKHSDRIVVARVGHTEVVEPDENSAHVRTALHVARNLKGKDEGPVVFVHHETWEEEGVEQPGTYKQGEQLLVFLERHGEEGDDEEARGGYTVDNATYGVKKLSDEDLKVYLARISELEQIEAQKTPDKTALVEWLVRCAEEKATRWEGAYELMLSAQALERANEEKEHPVDPARAALIAELSVDKHSATVEEYEAAVKRAREAAEAAAQSPSPAPAPGPPSDVNEDDLRRHTVGPGGREETVETRRATPRDPSLAAALGENQKRRLADALFGAEKMGEGEDALLQVVKDFGDARLVPFLVAQLRRVEDDAPPEAEAWLTVLSHVMKSEAALDLVMNYSENVTYYDYAIGELTDKIDEGEEAEETEKELTQEEQDAQEAAAIERARKKRSVMFKELLANVERILAAPQVARQ